MPGDDYRTCHSGLYCAWCPLRPLSNAIKGTSLHRFANKNVCLGFFVSVFPFSFLSSTSSCSSSSLSPHFFIFFFSSAGYFYQNITNHEKLKTDWGNTNRPYFFPWWTHIFFSFFFFFFLFSSSSSRTPQYVIKSSLQRENSYKYQRHVQSQNLYCGLCSFNFRHTLGVKNNNNNIRLLKYT